jgi:hypothetical protein
MWLKTFITGTNTIFIIIMKPPKNGKNYFINQENNVTMITKDAKGNSVVFLKITNFDNKIIDFVNSSDFRLLSSDPTQAYYRKRIKIVNFIKH